MIRPIQPTTRRAPVRVSVAERTCSGAGQCAFVAPNMFGQHDGDGVVVVLTPIHRGRSTTTCGKRQDCVRLRLSKTHECPDLVSLWCTAETTLAQRNTTLPRVLFEDRKGIKMSAYLLYLCQGVNDRDALETYWDKVIDTFVGVDIKLLSVYAAQELLEGEGPVEGVVVAEFPSMDVAKQWYDGAAYTEVRQHRLRGAKYIGLLVDGGITINVDDRMPQTRDNRPRAHAES
jgi:uncharacterized protein (DUF1330 family)/ferredoxin